MRWRRLVVGGRWVALGVLLIASTQAQARRGARAREKPSVSGGTSGAPTSRAPKPAGLADYSVGAVQKVLDTMAGGPGRRNFFGMTRDPHDVSRAFSVRDLARMLYIAKREAPGIRVARYQGGLASDPRYKDIDRLVSRFADRYDVPCDRPKRMGADWPPEYQCPGRPRAASRGPTPFVSLAVPMRPVAPPADPAMLASKAPPALDARLASTRRAALRLRDRGLHPGENLRGAVGDFCVGARCFRNYAQVAAAIHGASVHAPVFCAPRALPNGKWSSAAVDCSADWFDTLGKRWRPWRANGEPSSAPEPGVIPPYACVGSPHLFAKHVVVPAMPAAAGRSGFYCRNRIFRIQAARAAKSDSDRAGNIAAMCSEMRHQVWGEKYKDINGEYQRWCRKDPKRVKSGVCRRPKAKGGIGAQPAPPFMLLSREELLFFYGHQELFCRADRPGLTHFLYNTKWAATFTCGLARGLLEAGPFEEGVQACALSPFAGAEPPTLGPNDKGAFKARLHCWKFNRPTCEAVSNEEQARAEVYRSNVFDAYDALRELRRTLKPEVMALVDLKDAEKLTSHQDRAAFQDFSKDEGTFGVKEFCRALDARLSRLECGYTKETMARWYELRKDEPAQGCGQGVCARGAFKRGYMCGLFESPDFFPIRFRGKKALQGKPTWVCGFDVGAAGSAKLKDPTTGKPARAVCVGGARATSFQSPRGDRTSLQCYERRYRWGESAESERILRGVNWIEMVKRAASSIPLAARMISGGELKSAGLDPYRWTSWWWKSVNALAAFTFPPLYNGSLTFSEAAKDDAHLLRLAETFGHTLGHRLSLIPVVTPIKPGKHPPVAVRQFRGLVNMFAHQSLPTAPYGKSGPWVTYKGTKDDWARDENRVKELRGLVWAVLNAERMPDGRWYQEFLRLGTEGGKMRVTTGEVFDALRVHRMYAILEAARGELLGNARRYADAVFAQARKRPLLSRVGVHELARRDPIDGRFKGSIFCVSEPTGAADESTAPDAAYVCASSPLLVAGTVERAAEKDLPLPPDPAAVDQARRQVKFAWCYGGTEGEPMFAAHAKVLLRGDTSARSPFNVDVPDGLPRGKNKDLPTSAVNWMKCAGFQYYDVPWEQGVPERSQGGGLAGAGGAPPPLQARVDVSKLSSHPEAEKANDVMKEVGRMMGPMISFMLQFLQHGPDMVKNLSHPSAEFLGDWTKKLLDKAGPLWDQAKSAIGVEKGKIDAAAAIVQKAQDSLDDARTAFQKAEVDWASKTGPAKEAAKAERDRFEQALTAAHAELKSKTSELGAVTKQVGGAVNTLCKTNQQIAGSGDMLGGILEALSKLVMGRLMQVLEPNVRHLISFGMRFIRGLLGPIAAAVIGALGSVPFIGGVLAPIGQIVYDLAMNLLEDSAVNGLLGVIERLLSQLLRTVLTPIFKVVQDKLLAGVLGPFTQALGSFCGGTVAQLKFSALPPRDRWIERALACPGRVPRYDWIGRDAAVAQGELLQRAAAMRTQVARYARSIADRYLARYGLSYDSWMAAVGRDAHPVLVARASKLERGLRAVEHDLRGRLERAKVRATRPSTR